MSDRRIFLGQPGYGHPTVNSARAFWRACADESELHWSAEIGSLLAANFNKLWCSALNIVHSGGRVDYFAMLHDDISLPDGWLDDLIDEMEAHDLDVLGVVAPIKDNRGMTSMALHKDGDNWMPFCRLSMQDVYELPQTFTSDDLGRPLLLNTGCWVCRFDMEWATKVHFEINDRIVFNTAANAYQSQTEPEDWQFSRLLHEIGQPGSPTEFVKPLRIGATTKLALTHRGETDFENTKAWGRFPYDAEATNKSPVPGAFPRDIHGWLTPDEGKKLAELATDKNVLEIGSYCGLSTVCMARTANHIDAIDYHDGRGTPEPRNTLDEFLDNLERYEVSDKVTAYHPDHAPVHTTYDLILIDGAHDRDSVQADLDNYLAQLSENGLLVFHDYGEPMIPGVSEVVNELLANGAELVSVTDHLAVVKPAAVLLEI